MIGKRLRITLNNNGWPVSLLDRAVQAAGRVAGASVVTTAHTAREVLGTKRDPELSVLELVPENRVNADLFERALATIARDTLPPLGGREHLTLSHARQMQNARVFYAHLHEKRDTFVTEDVETFGSEGSARRARVESLGPRTRVLTLGEFERFCGGGVTDGG